MTVTQKHLNNIKSVFGGIKTWWSTKKTTETSIPESKPGRLQETLEKHKASQPVRRNPDCQGFYDEDNDLDDKFMQGARTQQYVKPVTHSAREEQLNENLGTKVIIRIYSNVLALSDTGQGFLICILDLSCYSKAGLVFIMRCQSFTMVTCKTMYLVNLF